MQSQSVLSLYGSGFTTGISVDLGYDSTEIVPVYEGGLISYARMQTHFASKDVLNFIKESLDARGIDLGPRPENSLEAIRRMMYVTQNIAMSRKDYVRTYTLPSGEEIEVSQECFMTAENMFLPELVRPCVACKKYVMSLQEAIVTSAMKCDPDLRPELYGAVVPCGGLAMIPGLNDRLELEIEQLTNKPANVISSSEAYAISWLGGATFAGMPASKKMWVSKKKFEEYGAKIVRNKFL